MTISHRIPLVPVVAALAAITAGPAAAAARHGAVHGAGAPPFVVVVQPASAQQGDYFDATTAPGKTIHPGTLLLRNTSAHRVRALLAAVDAQTASNLGSTYAVLGAPRHGPTLWTRLSQRRITLGPHASATVDVTVTVPSSAKAGDYLSGVSIQARKGSARTRHLRSNVEISSVVRYAIGVEVRIPGPRHPAISIDSVRLERQPRGLAFLVRATNTGNVILKNVTGTVVVTRSGGRVVQVPIGPGTFVTATSIELAALSEQQQVTEGTVFHVHASIAYAGGAAKLDRDVTFGSREAKLQQEFGGRKVSHPAGTPWAAIGGGAAALAGAGIALWLLARRRRDGVRALPPARETLAAALADPRRAGAPVSVITIFWKETEASTHADIAAVVRRRLRPTDTLAVGDAGELVIVATDTGATSATGFAEDLGSSLARELPAVSGSLRVGTATGVEPLATADELLAAAAADRQPVAL